MTHKFNLEETLKHVRHFLPAQGPIKDFVHHNTLHALQDLPFETAVLKGAQLYSARSYMPLNFYLQEYSLKKISRNQLEESLENSELHEFIKKDTKFGNITAKDLIFHSLFNYIDIKDNKVFESIIFGKVSKKDSDKLLKFLTKLNLPSNSSHQRLRSQFKDQLSSNIDGKIRPILFRLISGYLDQGISQWGFPKNDLPFYQAVDNLVQESWIPIADFITKDRLREFFKQPADQVILKLLEKIVGDPAQYEPYILETLLIHPGWSGMVATIESNPQSLLKPRNITLLDFLAVKLILEWEFIQSSQIPFQPLAQKTAIKSQALPFSLAQLLIEMKFNLKTLEEPSLKEKQDWVSLFSCLNPTQLAGVWHAAFENTYYHSILSSVQAHHPSRRKSPSITPQSPPSVQVMFCIDDRECSIRRYLEEVDPTIETFGAPGFFGLDFLFQSLNQSFPVQSCPINIKPKHLVREIPVKTHETLYLRQKKERERVALSQLRSHNSSMSFFLGWLSSNTLGHLSVYRLISSVLHPLRFAKALMSLQINVPTELSILREKEENELYYGYTHDEMAQRVFNVLNCAGLTKNFSEFVVMLAHGSSSVNNPHFSAYDCGACSGKPGAPNSRSFAHMANLPEVRQKVAEKGILIPQSTRFIGAFRNTCNDTLEFFDISNLSSENADQEKWNRWKKFVNSLTKASALNAKERCRRFALVELNISPETALEEVMKRSSAIFEPRPELNHATNSLLIVGRRSLTRGLFLDRRAFLNSYDPTHDADGAILNSILNAAIPVSGGINLEYYFSRVDNHVYGCGTKLPHNVAGLIGVMNGIDDDLRTGLPIQMVEVHDPVRLLAIIEQKPEIMSQVLAKNANVRQWVHHFWVKLACIDPDTGIIYFFNKNCQFQEMKFNDPKLATIPSSTSVVGTSRENLPTFEIQL